LGLRSQKRDLEEERRLYSLAEQGVHDGDSSTSTSASASALFTPPATPVQDDTQQFRAQGLAKLAGSTWKETVAARKQMRGS